MARTKAELYFSDFNAFPDVGSADTVYVAEDSNIMYRYDTLTSDYVSLNATGGGDMLKSVYDTNDDGIVNQADTITDQGDLATLDQVDTAQIVNHAVTNNQLAQMNANTYKGRGAGNGTPQDIVGKTAFDKDFGTSAGTVAEGNHTHTKDQVGLGNVDNTSDLLKPISTDTQNALNSKADITGETFTGKINLPPSTTDSAPLNLGTGTTPTAPLGGDVWISGDRLQFRDSTGATRALGNSGNLVAVTQANAEAGTEAVSRMWSSLRVRQAINGWWATITDVVKTFGDQTIGGDKTFTGLTKFSNNDTLFGDQTKNWVNIGNLGTGDNTYIDTQGVNTNVPLIIRTKGDGAVSIEADTYIDAPTFQVNGQNWTSAWTSYTPALINSTGATATILNARYKLIGKTCYLSVRLIITNKGTSSGEFGISTPFSPYYEQTVSGGIFPIGTATSRGFANASTVSGGRVQFTTGSQSSNLQWSGVAVNDEISISGSFEIA